MGEPGLFERTKRKKLSSINEMEGIAEQMREAGFEVTLGIVNNKWKSLPPGFRATEDNNNQLENYRLREGPLHCKQRKLSASEPRKTQACQRLWNII